MRILGLFLLAIILPLQAASLSGKWSVKGDVGGYAINLTCSFQQAGTSLTGTCQSPDRPDRVITGQVIDQKFKFQYDVDLDGNKFNVVYSGTLQPDDTLKGSVNANDNSGDFTATRLKQ